MYQLLQAKGGTQCRSFGEQSSEWCHNLFNDIPTYSIFYRGDSLITYFLYWIVSRVCAGIYILFYILKFIDANIMIYNDGVSCGPAQIIYHSYFETISLNSINVSAFIWVIVNTRYYVVSWLFVLIVKYYSDYAQKFDRTSLRGFFRKYLLNNTYLYNISYSL